MGNTGSNPGFVPKTTNNHIIKRRYLCQLCCQEYVAVGKIQNCINCEGMYYFKTSNK